MCAVWFDSLRRRGEPSVFHRPSADDSGRVFLHTGADVGRASVSTNRPSWSYTVTFAFVTYRLASTWLSHWVRAAGPVADDLGTLLAWACWALPLLFAEPLIQVRSCAGGPAPRRSRQRLKVRRPSQACDWGSFGAKEVEMLKKLVCLLWILSLTACATCKSSDSIEVCRTKQRDHSQPRP